MRDLVEFLVNASPREVSTLRDEPGADVPRQREGG
jgi:hypothetical protein